MSLSSAAQGWRSVAKNPHERVGTTSLLFGVASLPSTCLDLSLRFAELRATERKGTTPVLSIALQSHLPAAGIKKSSLGGLVSPYTVCHLTPHPCPASGTVFVFCYHDHRALPEPGPLSGSMYVCNVNTYHRDMHTWKCEHVFVRVRLHTHTSRQTSRCVFAQYVF